MDNKQHGNQSSSTGSYQTKIVLFQEDEKNNQNQSSSLNPSSWLRNISNNSGNDQEYQRTEENKNLDPGNSKYFCYKLNDSMIIYMNV